MQICLPVQSGKPFPTLYWLDDLALDKKLARLESKGGVRRIREWLLASPDRVESYHQLQQFYRDQRRSFIKLKEMALLPVGARKRIWETGIGGMEDWTLVRCLHMQFAFHLVHPNFIGAKIKEELDAQP